MLNRPWQNWFYWLANSNKDLSFVLTRKMMLQMEILCNIVDTRWITSWRKIISERKARRLTFQVRHYLQNVVEEIMRIARKAMGLILMSAFETCKDDALVISRCGTLVSHPTLHTHNSYKHHQHLSSITKYVIMCDLVDCWSGVTWDVGVYQFCWVDDCKFHWATVFIAQCWWLSLFS